MSENIKSLIEKIDNIEYEVEELKNKREFGEMRTMKSVLNMVKYNLAEAVREEYKNDTKTRL